ncbi:MAG: DUF262 domain-containing protein [Deltaproteobacteria bacterium]|nr:DUF262 domain-containing protein [Deltaproteobacteria bacterium]
MYDFEPGRYPKATIWRVYTARDQIELDPVYQRIGGVWPLEKKQLLLDSILNDFDIPKLYFHEFLPAKIKDGRQVRYAIVDGKQRLQAIWDFIDGRLHLGDDFVCFRDPSVKAGGLSYAQLATQYPDLKSGFDGMPLDIVTIRSESLDPIEEMFSRLNEAVPLNAPEKRNALGGPIPKLIAALSRHPFFLTKVAFPDKRYRHRDLSAKFLFLAVPSSADPAEQTDGLRNTKKVDLDGFVKEYKKHAEKKESQASPKSLNELSERATSCLDKMCTVFIKQDPLLRQVGMITLYYYFFRDGGPEIAKRTRREDLLWFEGERDSNRKRAEQFGEASEKGGVDNHLLEFERHAQTPNDAYALRIRLGILVQYLGRHLDGKKGRGRAGGRAGGRIGGRVVDHVRASEMVSSPDGEVRRRGRAVR